MAVIGYLADVLRRNGREGGLRQGLEYLAGLSGSFLAAEGPGYSQRVELDGEALVALHQVYLTRDPATARLEAHRRHIDLQFVLSGEERLGFATLASGQPIDPYDPEKDVAFFASDERTDLLLRAGMVVILYPEDLHAPSLWVEGPGRVAKTVVKIRV